MPSGALASSRVPAQTRARIRQILLVAAGFSVAINLLLLMPSLYMLQVYDRVLTSRSLETLSMLTLIVTFALLVMALLDTVRTALMGVCGALIEKALGPSVVEAMLREAVQPARANSPDLAARGLRDVGTVKGFLASPALFALFDAPWVLAYSLVIYLFHPLLGLIAILSAVALLVLAWIGERATRAGIEQSLEAAYKGNRFIESAQRSAEAVVAMRMEAGIAREWKARNLEAQDGQLRAADASNRITAFTKFFRQFVQIGMLGAAAYVTIQQNATPGVMIAATVLLGRALAPAEQAIGAWRQLIEVRGAWQRLNLLFARMGESSLRTTLPQPAGHLQVEGLSYSPAPGQPPILRNISFAVQPGELLAVVGPSGSGKSTLARLLVGIWDTGFGKIRLDDAELRTWDRDQLGQLIGYLPQDVELIAGTVGSNIARLSARDDAATVAAAQLANAHQMIVRLPKGYETEIADRSAYTLSGGQRQRVGLARALFGNPKLVVLDEPNSSLDTEGDDALHAALKALKERQVCVVVITQRTKLLGLADKFLVLKEGAVERYGPREEIERQLREQRAKQSPGGRNLTVAT